MRVILKCPDCSGKLPFDAVNSPDAATCGRCGLTIPLAVSETIRGDQAVDVCPVCTGSDFYVRRDFDPNRGLSVIIIMILTSMGFYWFGLDLIAYAVLGVFALLDLLVYRRLKDVTVCYRCHTVFRGAYKPSAPVFDLATADELELEWARTLEKRAKNSDNQNTEIGKQLRA